MSNWPRAPLLGHKLVRIVYLDEAGTSRKEPALTVAGVIVHGDHESTELCKRLDSITAKHIPEADRDTVVFHATDIFHGSGYFDRRRWPLEQRLQILTDLANIIESLHLPVVSGGYEKDKYGPEMDWSATTPEIKKMVMHGGAAMDCVLWVDRWLAKYAPTENALITAEDNDYVKKITKNALRTLRSKSLMEKAGMSSVMDRLDLPLKRIIDTAHFAAKQECPALQLADLCAFIIGRVNKQKKAPEDVAIIIAKHLMWRNAWDLRVVSDAQAS